MQYLRNTLLTDLSTSFWNDSYEGKKSALAAASISKECPYQHHGVLFHAEVLQSNSQHLNDI
jgi:hypothetical protein